MKSLFSPCLRPYTARWNPWLGLVVIATCLSTSLVGAETSGNGRAGGALDVADLSSVKSKAAPSHVPFSLVEKGASKVSICLVKPNPSGKLQQIVNELQLCIEQSTGAKLPIIEGKIVEPAIVIGDCEAAAKMGLVGKAMPSEGYELKTSENSIYIVGNDESAGEGTPCDGTAWGVTDFNERFVGTRWYWALAQDGRSIRKQASISIPPMWYSDAPAFHNRNYWPENFHPQVLFLRNTMSWPQQLRVHQPDEWTRDADFIKNRPEIFQMNPDGSRDHSMYCYSNPKTLATFMEQIDAHYAGTKAASFIVGDTITVSPRDIGIGCRCPDCVKLYDEKGGNLGSASPIMVNFVTRLSAEVEKKHKNKSILMLAYMNYTRAPKGAKLPKNVFVEVCGMNGIANYKEPAIFAEDQAPIDDWIGASGNKVQEWQYSCWPADRVLAPYQYPHVLQEFYRHNRDKSVGCFINSGVENEWERFHVTFYAWLKLLWNPEFPVDAAIDEYCKRMYGPAAATVRQIVQMQCDGWEKSRWPNGRLTPKAVYELSFPKATLDKFRELLAKAKTEAEPDALASKRLAFFSSIFQTAYDEYAIVMEGTGVQPMSAFKVAKSPVVDGKLDDEQWKIAEPVFLKKYDEYGTKKQIEVSYPTEAKAVYTLDGITFGFKLTEPSPESLKRKITTNDNGLTYWDDCIELFLDSTGKNEGQFVQLLSNANGALQVINTGHGTAKPEDIISKSALGDKMWSMEIYIPYKVLAPAARGGTGTKWTIQITRNRMSDSDINKERPRENQKLNARFGGFNANPADFTTLNFRE